MLLALAIAGLFVLPDPWRIVAVCAAAVIEIGEIYLWIRYLRRYRVKTGVEAMIGQTAEVIGPGRVRVRGEIWTARGPTERGRTVRITSVDGLTLVVEPEV